MDRLTRFSFRNSAVVVLIALIVFFAGLQSANQLKKETMPDISVPYIMVVTIYPGAAPHDVYTDVTDPLEKAIRGVGGVKMVTASSGDSYSAVIAEFNYSEDMDKAETNVNKAMQAVKLPKTAMAPTVSRIGFSARPVLKLAVVGAQESDHDALRSQLSDKFVPALKGVSGVGKAEIVADTPYAVHIKFDAKKLAADGLDPASIIQQLQAGNLSFPIGTLDTAKTSEPVRVTGTLAGVQDIKDFRVAVYPNQSKLLKSAFTQVGDGMKQLGSGMKSLGSGMRQMGDGVTEGFTTLGGVSTQIGTQAGLINGIQQVQAQLYSLKYDTLPQLKAAASQTPTDTPAYVQLQGQIDQIQNKAIPAMNTAIASMQSKITASQKKLAATASSSSSSSGSSLSSSNGNSTKATKTANLDASVKVVKLSDIAEVTYSPADGSIGTRENGQSAVLINVAKSPSANTVDVVNAARAEIDTQRADLPPGTKVDVLYDASVAVNDSVNGMLREGLIGALFAIIVILLFLRNIRATVVAVVSIPLSLLITLTVLQAMGVTLNIMTLGGLTVAVGRIVDDSIVVIENIYRHLQLGGKRGSDLVIASTSEVASAITSSTLTTVAVFVPLGLVQGIAGKAFQPFAIAVTVAMLASLLVALTLVPLLARWFLLTGKPPREAKDGGFLASTYRRILAWALGRRSAVIGVAVLLFIAAIGLVPLLGTGFLPASNDRVVQINVAYPDGVRAVEVDKTIRRLEAILSKDRNVERYSSTIGVQDSSMSVMQGGSGGTNRGSTFVKLTDSANPDAAVRQIKGEIAYLEHDGVSIALQRISSIGGDNSLEVDITGPDDTSIREGQQTVAKLMKGEDGLESITSVPGPNRKQLVVAVNQPEAAKQGMMAGLVAGTVRNSIAAQDAGTIKINGRNTDVTWSTALASRDRRAQLASLKLTTPLDDKIRLDSIASVTETQSPTSVLTRNGVRTASVTGYISAPDQGSVISRVRSDLAALTLPKGVRVQVAGVADTKSESMSQLGTAMAVAVALVFLVMTLAFGDVLAPLAIMFSLPLAIVGCVFGLLICQLPLDMPAMIGALMLIGIVVTNAIVLLERVRAEEHNGLGRTEALLEAGGTRFRPILMTAVATIMALVPLAAGMAEGALISQSMAVVVIGGLTTSTLLTLLVVPVAYDLLEGAKDRVLVRMGPSAETPTPAE